MVQKILNYSFCCSCFDSFRRCEGQDRCTQKGDFYDSGRRKGHTELDDVRYSILPAIQRSLLEEIVVDLLGGGAEDELGRETIARNDLSV